MAPEHPLPQTSSFASPVLPHSGWGSPICVDSWAWAPADGPSGLDLFSTLSEGIPLLLTFWMFLSLYRWLPSMHAPRNGAGRTVGLEARFGGERTI